MGSSTQDGQVESNTASSAICRVWLMQAGSITIPEDFVLLPSNDTKNQSFQETPEQSKARSFTAPDFVFLIEHVPTGEWFLYDLGMRKDLQNLPPYVCTVDLPIYECRPQTPQEILTQHGPAGYHPDKVKAIILSHLHWDHIGDCGRESFPHAELWMGPSACREARPGYPSNPTATCYATDFPRDGSRTIVEFTIPRADLEDRKDCRANLIEQWQNAGHYEAIEARRPRQGWRPLASFEHAFRLFDDDSTFLIDSPGHAAGHMSLLVRVKAQEHHIGGDGGSADCTADLNRGDYVLLAGDTFHHPALLRDPRRVARAPYSRYSIHDDNDLAVETIIKTRELARRENVWVIASHDMSIMTTLSSKEGDVAGLTLLNDWRNKGWKGHQGTGNTTGSS